jgi:adenylate cyclase
VKFGFSRLSISTRRKFAYILLAVIIFALLAGLTDLARGRSAVFGTFNAILVGIGVGLFEEFYVQTLRGRWMRSIHPLHSIIICTVFVAIMFLIATNVTHLLLYPFYDLPVPYGRLAYILPIFMVLSVIGIVVIRTVHFIGIETLFHLMVGTYHRPVVEEKVIVFLDINDSTGLAERLGAVQTKSMVGKFLFDISKPITDHSGEIYLYKGDGLIALWPWREAVRDNLIFKAIDAVFGTIEQE